MSSKSGSTYDSTWETSGYGFAAKEDQGNMAWYIGLNAAVALNIVLFISIVVRSSPVVEDKLNEKEKDYTKKMFWLAGLFQAYALYSSVFPTQYISYFVWHDNPLSSLFVAWMFNTLGQVCGAMQVQSAVNFCISQCYGEDVLQKDKPADFNYPKCAEFVLLVYLICTCVAAAFGLWGLVTQDWTKFLIMTCFRLGGILFALSTTFKLYCTAKWLRERVKGEASSCVDCNTWSAEPMAFVYTIYFLGCIIWMCAVEIPKTMAHISYQDMAMVPTLELSTGFDEAMNRRSFSRVGSVWTPMVLGTYFASLCVTSTLAVFMAAAPRLLKYNRSQERHTLMTDYTYSEGREGCQILLCSIQ
jgi:hypothetical protein